jgi:hypothetical protein
MNFQDSAFISAAWPNIALPEIKSARSTRPSAVNLNFNLTVPSMPAWAASKG